MFLELKPLWLGRVNGERGRVSRCEEGVVGWGWQILLVAYPNMPVLFFLTEATS